MSTIHPAQLDPFALSGAGASLGDTSITLKSFQDIDGNNLSMSDFGSIGFGTIDPGNGALEEQISFTGVAQNSNGTATLSGVSSVTFLTPYTATSGLAKTHAGSTTFVISNTAGFYNNIPFKQNDETITGQWTFDTFPITPDVPVATTSVSGTSKLSVDAADVDHPITVGTNDPRLVYYAASSTGTDTYVITVSPVPTEYLTGQSYFLLADVANSGTATLNVNSLGAKSILRSDGSALSDGDIGTTDVVQVVYDGTQFRLLSSSTEVKTFTSSGSWSKPTNAKSVDVILIGAGGGGGGGKSPSGGTGGGGAGGGGGYTKITFPASVLSSTVTVTVGTGGTGGAANASGAAGGDTTFGTYAKAGGGGLGAVGGSSTAGASGAAGSGIISGGAAGTSSGASLLGGAAGGPGGSSNNSGTDGGAVSAIPRAGGAAGTGGSGAAGSNGTSAAANEPTGGSGGGGGSGQNSTGAGGAGGAGGTYGGGGGGGGGNFNGSGTAGAGGNGANGIAVVISYF